MARISKLILASSSATRHAMLLNAGIDCVTMVPAFDEATVKTAARARGLDADACARELAIGKATAVSVSHPEAWVIGADQMLEMQGEWFDKSIDLDEASRQLAALNGQTHHLISAVVLMRDGAVVWQESDRATLYMRQCSAAFLGGYVPRQGRDILGSVGGYRIEGEGVQLFERVDGDYFTILGLPLLPLLAALRRHGVIQR